MEKSIIDFTCTDKNGKIYLEPKAFAQYAAQRWTIRYHQENFYRYRHGKWEYWPDDRLKAFLFKFLESVDGNIFTLAAEKRYIEILKRICYSYKSFNSDKSVINMQNGMLRLKDAELIPHNSKFLSTIQLPYEYKATAKCPGFIKFLDQVFMGDSELIAFVQELMGYCLSPDMEAQKFFILYGHGSNGKSVFCEILRCLVGEENSSALSIKALEQKFAVADLEGKPLNISTENEGGNRPFNTQQIKAITGGDTLKAERKHKDVFSISPICKLVFAVNNLPRFSDNSYGFVRRIVVIPFEAVFSKEAGTENVHLVNELKKELPGIFNFALVGLVRLRANDYKFTYSRKIEQYTNQYVDIFGKFINEVIEITNKEKDRVKRSDVKKIFDTWAEGSLHPNLSEISCQKFWNELKRAFERRNVLLQTVKSNGDNYITGLKLKTDFMEE